MRRDEAKIKVPRSHRIFVGSFYCDAGHIVSYVTKIAMKNTDKKTGQIGILINASSLITHPLAKRCHRPEPFE